LAIRRRRWLGRPGRREERECLNENMACEGGRGKAGRNILECGSGEENEGMRGVCNACEGLMWCGGSEMESAVWCYSAVFC